MKIVSYKNPTEIPLSGTNVTFTTDVLDRIFNIFIENNDERKILVQLNTFYYRQYAGRLFRHLKITDDEFTTYAHPRPKWEDWYRLSKAGRQRVWKDHERGHSRWIMICHSAKYLSLEGYNSARTVAAVLHKLAEYQTEKLPLLVTPRDLFRNVRYLTISKLAFRETCDEYDFDLWYRNHRQPAKTQWEENNRKSSSSTRSSSTLADTSSISSGEGAETPGDESDLDLTDYRFKSEFEWQDALDMIITYTNPRHLCLERPSLAMCCMICGYHREEWAKYLIYMKILRRISYVIADGSWGLNSITHHSIILDWGTEEPQVLPGIKNQKFFVVSNHRSYFLSLGLFPLVLPLRKLKAFGHHKTRLRELYQPQNLQVIYVNQPKEGNYPRWVNHQSEELKERTKMSSSQQGEDCLCCGKR